MAANKTIVANLESEIYVFLHIIHKYSTSQINHFLTTTLNPKFLQWIAVVFYKAYSICISRELVVDAKNFGASDTCLQMCNPPPHLSQTAAKLLMFQ